MATKLIKSGCLIPRHVAVNLVRPRRDAAFDALDVFEALLAQEIQRLQRAHAGFAVQIILLVRVEFGEAFVELAQRQQRHAGDLGNLVFVGFAHVHDLDVEARIIERLLHVLHGDLVGIAGGFRLRHDAAEGLVINQFLDRRLFAANRTRRIFAQFQFAELHVERIE